MQMFGSPPPPRPPFGTRYPREAYCPGGTQEECMFTEFPELLASIYLVEMLGLRAKNETKPQNGGDWHGFCVQTLARLG